VSATTAHCQQVNKPDPKLRVELTAILPLSWWRSLGRVILNVGALTKRTKSQLERQEREHPESTQRICKE
jgi:hypothetical protein